MSGYLLLDNAEDQYAETAHKTQLAITGPLELIACFNSTLLGETGVGGRFLIGKRGGGGQRSWYWGIRGQQADLTFGWSTDGSDDNFTNPGWNLTSGRKDQDMWARIAFNPDDGSERVAQAWLSDDPPNTAVGSVSWTNLGIFTGDQTSLNAGTNPLFVGARDAGVSGQAWDGRIYAAWVLDGIGGTLVANPDWRTGTQGWATPPGNDGVGAGNSWSFEQGAIWVPPDSGLAVPTGLDAVAVSATQIDLSWDAVTEADAYDVERDSVIIASKHTSTTFEDTGLTPDTEYSYRVRAARQV